MLSCITALIGYSDQPPFFVIPVAHFATVWLSHTSEGTFRRNIEQRFATIWIDNALQLTICCIAQGHLAAGLISYRREAAITVIGELAAISTCIDFSRLAAIGIKLGDIAILVAANPSTIWLFLQG